MRRLKPEIVKIIEEKQYDDVDDDDDYDMDDETFLKKEQEKIQIEIDRKLPDFLVKNEGNIEVGSFVEPTLGVVEDRGPRLHNFTQLDHCWGEYCGFARIQKHSALTLSAFHDVLDDEGKLLLQRLWQKVQHGDCVDFRGYRGTGHFYVEQVDGDFVFHEFSGEYGYALPLIAMADVHSDSDFRALVQHYLECNAAEYVVVDCLRVQADRYPVLRAVIDRCAARCAREYGDQALAQAETVNEHLFCLYLPGFSHDQVATGECVDSDEMSRFIWKPAHVREYDRSWDKFGSLLPAAFVEDEAPPDDDPRCTVFREFQDTASLLDLRWLDWRTDGCRRKAEGVAYTVLKILFKNEFAMSDLVVRKVVKFSVHGRAPRPWRKTTN